MWRSKQHATPLQTALVLVATWLACLIVIATTAAVFVPYQPSFPYFDTLLPDTGLPQYLYSFANFDGVHYLTIGTRGYQAAELVQAFFPAFPMLLMLLGSIGVEPVLGGLILNWVLFAVAVWLFQLLLQNFLSAKQVDRAVLWLLLFPTSFFFATLYTESLFLVLVVGALLAAERRQWLVAGCLIALCSATRLVGLFLVPAVILQYYLDVPSKKWWQFWKVQRSLWPVACISIGVLGLVGYMIYLWRVFGDPLLFLHVQAEFGAGRQESLVLLPQTMWRSLKIIMTVPLDLKWWSYLQDVWITILALIGLSIGTLRTHWVQAHLPRLQYRALKWVPELPLSWYVFSWLAILLPTATGTLSSMPRYVLVALPLFAILACMPLPKWGRVAVYLLSTSMLVLNTILFIQGYWVA